MPESEINEILKRKGDLVSDLLAAVKEAGAPDNVTIILSEVVEIDEASELAKLGAANG